MTPTYLPPAPPRPIALPEKSRTLLSAPYASLATGADGQLRLLGPDGAPLVEAFSLWREPAPAGAAPALAAAEGVRIVWAGEDEIASLGVAPVAGSAALDVTFAVEFRRKRRVVRDALVLALRPDLVFAAGPNGFAPPAPPAHETWLGRGTVAYGSGDRRVAIFHPTGVSSLQIDPARGHLWINFDWAEDHPHVTVSRTANWDDASPVEWPQGARRASALRLHFGMADAPVVRPMLAPHGALAAFVWTEHACNSDLRMHRAVYFGHERIARSRDATGGFAKHRIPVTKSVFFANPGADRIKVRGAAIDGEMISIRGNRDFESFLLDLRDAGGYEIVPHGIQPDTTPRAEFDAALAYMRGTFGSRSWIDHCTFRGEDVSGGDDGYLAFGNDAASPHYRADLWRAHGFKYFWNHAIEYKEIIPRHDPPPSSAPPPRPPFSLRLRSALAAALPEPLMRALRAVKRKSAPPDPALDQLAGPPARPAPLYWRHPSATGEFVNWATRSTPAAYFRTGDGPVMRHRLDTLVANWGVALHHSYPTRVDEGNAAWRRDRDGSFAVSEDFDSTLAHMARLRDAGDLHLGTIGELVAHWESLERLRVEPQADGTTIVRNAGGTPVLGATFAVRGAGRRLAAGAYRARQAGADTVLCCDLAPGECVRVL